MKESTYPWTKTFVKFVDKKKADLSTYSAIVAAVAHREFDELDMNQYSKDGATVIYDIKEALPKDKVDARL